MFLMIGLILLVGQLLEDHLTIMMYGESPNQRDRIGMDIINVNRDGEKKTLFIMLLAI